MSTSPEEFDGIEAAFDASFELARLLGQMLVWPGPYHSASSGLIFEVANIPCIVDLPGAANRRQWVRALTVRAPESKTYRVIARPLDTDVRSNIRLLEGRRLGEPYTFVWAGLADRIALTRELVPGGGFREWLAGHGGPVDNVQRILVAHPEVLLAYGPRPTVVEVIPGSFDTMTADERRARREQLSLTQEQAAVAAGITESHLSDLERGVHAPTPLTTSALNSVYSLTGVAPQSWGDFVRVARARAGWTQDELARRAKYSSKSIVSDLELDRHRPTQEHYRRIRRLLGTAIPNPFLNPDQEPPRTAAEAIRRARNRKAWTQKELATRAGLNPTWVCHLERGRGDPNPVTLQALSSALGVDLTVWAQPTAHERPLAL